MPALSAKEAIKIISSGHHIFIQGGTATPHKLVEAMTSKAAELKNVSIYHIHTEGDIPYAHPSLTNSFQINSFFLGHNIRDAVQSGHAQYIPVFLSEIPALFRSGTLPLDVALVQVSPPDKHGYCSLGVSVDISLAAMERAQYVVAQVNPQMPRTHGDGLVHIDKFHAYCDVDEPIPEVTVPAPNDREKQIGRHIAEIVEDRATLQMGIGGIPNAVLSCLANHKDLGIHTEMFTDGVIDLVEKGVITGRFKKKHPHKIVSGFVMGSSRLYDFIDDNPEVQMLDIAYVNDTSVIRQNPKVTAINSAIEVDLTGQVCADSIGTLMYSGVGGQMDFIRGASLSEGGKPIIALPSTTRQGISRIVPTLKPGAGVVTTRAHVHYVVTEYGAVNLYGKNLFERAMALAGIAHPDHREDLEYVVFERFKKLY